MLNVLILISQLAIPLASAIEIIAGGKQLNGPGYSWDLRQLFLCLKAQLVGRHSLQLGRCVELGSGQKAVITALLCQRSKQSLAIAGLV